MRHKTPRWQLCLTRAQRWPALGPAESRRPRANEVNSRSKFVSQVTIPRLTQEPAVFVRQAASSITNKQNDNSLIILLTAAAGGKNRGLKVSAVTASLSVIFSSAANRLIGKVVQSRRRPLLRAFSWLILGQQCKGHNRQTVWLA